jgi:hypothetical protein
MNDKGIFPDPPTFTKAEFEACRSSRDYCPVLFEWYKYVGHVTNLVASIDIASPVVKKVPTSHFGALIGLLNRCCRLMLANVALSHEGLFGETTALVDRCVFESTVKVLWLCRQNSDDAFRRFFAEGLKIEVSFKAEIETRIVARGNQVLQIEERMLKSIARYLATSGMTDSEIKASKKLPNLAAMIEELGHERLAYIVGQKIGSHHVHGTWSSLLSHYLEWDDDGSFQPRDHDCRTHVSQYVFIPLMVLSATKAFCNWLMDDEDAQAFIEMLKSIEDEILAINKNVMGNDLNVTKEI